MAGTALAKLRDEPSAVALLQDASDRIAPLLPKGVDISRVILTTRLAIRKNPKILDCEPESIVTAVAQVQQWGLEIGTTAHLVPFNTNVAPQGQPKQWVSICTPIADYKGLAELVVGSGAVRHCEARCVYANEPFIIEQGLVPKLEHHPVHEAKDRGPMIGAYVIFRLAFRNVAFEFYPIADIDATRKKYSKQWKDLDETPDWYAMKTAIRRGVKLIPKNPRLASVLRVIEAEELVERDGVYQTIEQQRPASDGAADIRPSGAATPPPAAPTPTAPATPVRAVAASDGPIPQPAPAGATPAPNAAKLVTPTSITDDDLAWAAKIRLLGKPDKWGGNGGKPMGELPSSLLEQVRDFFAKKRSEAGQPDERLDTQVRAAAIILADREREQLTLDSEDEVDLPDDLPTELPAALKDVGDDGLPF